MVRRLARKASFVHGGGAGNLLTDADPLRSQQLRWLLNSSQAVPLRPALRRFRDAGSSCLPSSTKRTTRRLEVRLLAKFRLGINCTSQSWAHSPQEDEEEEEPAADQPQALPSQVWHAGQRAVCRPRGLEPFGRNATRAKKFRTWIPTADGSYISREVLGLGTSTPPPTTCAGPANTSHADYSQQKPWSVCFRLAAPAAAWEAAGSRGAPLALDEKVASLHLPRGQRTPRFGRRCDLLPFEVAWVTSNVVNLGFVIGDSRRRRLRSRNTAWLLRSEATPRPPFREREAHLRFLVGAEPTCQNEVRKRRRRGVRDSCKGDPGRRQT